MKVILQADVRGSGKAGQLVEVSDGYARNYLLPRKLAVEANAGNVNTMKTKEAARQHKIDVERQAAVEMCEKLRGRRIRVEAKGGQSGKLFGAVTSKEIAAAIKAQCGVEIDRRKLSVSELKNFGDYPAEARFYSDVAAPFTVVVVPDAGV